MGEPRILGPPPTTPKMSHHPEIFLGLKGKTSVEGGSHLMDLQLAHWTSRGATGRKALQATNICTSIYVVGMLVCSNLRVYVVYTTTLWNWVLISLPQSRKQDAYNHEEITIFYCADKCFTGTHGLGIKWLWIHLVCYASRLFPTFYFLGMFWLGLSAKPIWLKLISLWT